MINWMIDCVDIKTNACIFGYGGIDVGVIGQTIIFKGIKPPQGAGTRIWDRDGTKLGEWEYTGSQILVSFKTMGEIETVCDCLKTIEENQDGLFKFKDITFDFTEYKQVSMDIVKAAMRDVRLNVLQIMAC